MNISQFIHSVLGGHWGGFLFLTIMDSPAINILINVFGKHMSAFLLGGCGLFYDCCVLVSFLSVSRLRVILENSD